MEFAFADSPAEYPNLRIEEIDLNREAVSLNSFQRARFPHSHTGFVWNAGDFVLFAYNLLKLDETT